MFYEEKCTLCGECLMKCHYLAYPEKKAKEEFKKLINGEPSPVTSECITCVACNMICPEGANPFDLINIRQEETGTFKFAKRMLKMFDMGVKTPSKVIQGEPGKPVMSLCLFGDMLPGVFEGQLYDGLTFLQGGDYFCWIGMVHTARPSLVNKKNIQTFVDNLASSGAEEIILFHDDCYATLTIKVKEFDISVPFKPIHIIEYLRDYVKNHRDQVNKFNMKVAYQQPCASRYTFEKDKILDELFELIGAERVKRKYDKEEALCCGGIQSAMENVSVEEENMWRMKNIMDAKEAGAEAFIFLCPLCIGGLRGRAKGQGMEPYILSNLVRVALGEKLTHGGAGKKLD
jgi:Fe-S oxidoreductase